MGHFGSFWGPMGHVFEKKTGGIPCKSLIDLALREFTKLQELGRSWSRLEPFGAGFAEKTNSKKAATIQTATICMSRPRNLRLFEMLCDYLPLFATFCDFFGRKKSHHDPGVTLYTFSPSTRPSLGK